MSRFYVYESLMRASVPALEFTMFSCSIRSLLVIIGYYRAWCVLCIPCLQLGMSYCSRHILQPSLESILVGCVRQRSPTPPRFLAGPRQVAEHLASLFLDLVSSNAANVPLFKDQSVVDYPVGGFGRIESHSFRRVSAKRFVSAFEPCHVLDLDAFGCEVVLFHDPSEAFCLIL